MEPGEVRFFRPFDENKERYAMEHTDMGQLRDGQRGLSNGERKMLHSAKQILISEIVLSKSVSYESAEEELNTALA